MLFREVGSQVEARKQVHVNRFAFVPVGGYLEHGRTADALVSKEQVFFEAGAVTDDTSRDRKSGETPAEFQGRPFKPEGYQPGSHRRDLQPELPGHLLRIAGRSHLGN